MKYLSYGASRDSGIKSTMALPARFVYLLHATMWSQLCFHQKDTIWAPNALLLPHLWPILVIATSLIYCMLVTQQTARSLSPWQTILHLHGSLYLPNPLCYRNN